MANHKEARRDVLQHLRDIFAQLAQRAAALWAGLFFRKMGVNFASEMFRQRATLAGGGCGSLRRSRRSRFVLGLGRLGNRSLQAFELKFELLDLAANLLRLAPELHAPQFGDDQFQMLDLGIQSHNQRLHRCRIQCIQIRRCRGRIQHEASMPRQHCGNAITLRVSRD